MKELLTTYKSTPWVRYHSCVIDSHLSFVELSFSWCVSTIIFCLKGFTLKYCKIPFSLLRLPVLY